MSTKKRKLVQLFNIVVPQIKHYDEVENHLYKPALRVEDDLLVLVW
jgi:hypothetical protein